MALKGKFIFGVVLSVVFVAATTFVSCATPVYKQKMYADVIGFNDDVTTVFASFDLTRENQRERMNAAIDNLKSGQNTAAYLAMDIALDRIAEVNKNKDLMEGDPDTQYFVIFFTDGIDNASVAQAKIKRRGNYPQGPAGLRAYGAALQKRMPKILTKKILGIIPTKSTTNVFQSYVLLFNGPGSGLEEYSEGEIETMLSPLIGAQNTLPAKFIIGDDLENLLNQFINTFSSSFKFEIPLARTGLRIRMVFDESQDIYFEGTFVEKRGLLGLFKNSYTLENIRSSDGFRFDLPKGKLEMDRNSFDPKVHTNVPFFLDKLQLNGSPYRVDRNDVKQWYEENGRYRPEVEYSGSGRGRKNAYIILVMDTSSSLGDEVDAAKDLAKELIWYITEQM